MVNKLKMKKSRKAETSEHWYGNSELWLVGDEEGRFAELTSSSASCISRLSPMGFTISLSFTFALRQFTLRSTAWVKYCSHFGTSDWSGERCSRRFKIVKTIPSPDIRRTKDMYIPAIKEKLYQFLSDSWRKKIQEQSINVQEILLVSLACVGLACGVRFPVATDQRRKIR